MLGLDTHLEAKVDALFANCLGEQSTKRYVVHVLKAVKRAGTMECGFLRSAQFIFFVAQAGAMHAIACAAMMMCVRARARKEVHAFMRRAGHPPPLCLRPLHPPQGTLLGASLELSPMVTCPNVR